MENEPIPQFRVSDFLAVVNQSLEVAFGAVEIEGEVAGFKLNQQKYLFFDLKDEEGSVGCFMMAWQLRLPVEDGMRVVVRAVPKVTKWGKFSLTVQSIRPVGEGSLKRAHELLRRKLESEGLFAAERKRRLPEIPERIGVVSSTGAAGYKDFIKLVGERWGGLDVEVAQVQVQGEASVNQVVQAIEYFNLREQPPEVIVIIRGGGSADDLASFSDEAVVRAIAGSRVPTLVGVGHETDESLADLAADVRASTPSHAAQLIVPDRREVTRQLEVKIWTALDNLELAKAQIFDKLENGLRVSAGRINNSFEVLKNKLDALHKIIVQLDPRTVLARGYAIVRDETGDLVTQPSVGESIKIETINYNIEAEVTNVKPKNN